jgi:hypothetical protein
VEEYTAGGGRVILEKAAQAGDVAVAGVIGQRS